MINYEYKRIIRYVFDNYERVRFESGSDGMGEYIKYGWPTDYFWYPDRDVILDRWEQKVEGIPYVRFRKIHTGYGDDYRHSVMELEGKYYLINGAQVRFGSDKLGPHGVSVFHFTVSKGKENEKKIMVKTERSLKMVLNKLEVIPI